MRYIGILTGFSPRQTLNSDLAHHIKCRQLLKTALKTALRLRSSLSTGRKKAYDWPLDMSYDITPKFQNV